MNMSKKRIESAISFSTLNSLKELQSFLGLVNYFKGHLRDHSAIAKPLYDMVTVTIRNKIKLLTWTNEGHLAFERLKALVNVCTKVYFIDYSLRIILYTDASDYAHGIFVSLKSQFVSWVAYSTGPRYIGELLRRRLAPFIGPFYVLTFTLRYKQTTGTYFS